MCPGERGSPCKTESRFATVNGYYRHYRNHHDPRLTKTPCKHGCGAMYEEYVPVLVLEAYWQDLRAQDKRSHE